MVVMRTQMFLLVLGDCCCPVNCVALKGDYSPISAAALLFIGWDLPSLCASCLHRQVPYLLVPQQHATVKLPFGAAYCEVLAFKSA